MDGAFVVKIAGLLAVIALADASLGYCIGIGANAEEAGDSGCVGLVELYLCSTRRCKLYFCAADAFADPGGWWRNHPVCWIKRNWCSLRKKQTAR
jgi:hypothetical protein